MSDPKARARALCEELHGDNWHDVEPGQPAERCGFCDEIRRAMDAEWNAGLLAGYGATTPRQVDALKRPAGEERDAADHS